jgi:hypothetical protein
MRIARSAAHHGTTSALEKDRGVDADQPRCGMGMDLPVANAMSPDRSETAMQLISINAAFGNNETMAAIQSEGQRCDGSFRFRFSRC